MPRNPDVSGDTGSMSSIADIRERARRHISDGAITSSYDADRPTVIRLLNEALATELVCTLRYRRHYFMADGVLAEGIKKEFLTHALEEQEHADQIAERIVQLRGEPDFNPSTLSNRSHAEYVEGTTLEEMLKEDLVAERIAIDSYREMIAYIETRDSTTRRMLEGILAKEEEHAEELASMMEDVRELLGQASGDGKPGHSAGKSGSAQQADVEAAVKDPTQQFSSPGAVLEDSSLSTPDKRQILESWVKDSELLAVAESENMGGGESSNLRESTLALAELDAGESPLERPPHPRPGTEPDLRRAD